MLHMLPPLPPLEAAVVTGYAVPATPTGRDVVVILSAVLMRILMGDVAVAPLVSVTVAERAE
jgi:hypothetical protein